jgi:hypothetical protein
MFSQVSPLPLAKRKRASVNERVYGGSKKKKTTEVLEDDAISGKNGMSRQEREESPLFEPEAGFQTAIDANIDMLSPPLTPPSNTRLRSSKKGQPVAISGSRSKRPVIVEGGLSSSDISSNIVILSRDLLETSLLPGNVLFTDDYIKLLEEITSKAAATSAHERLIDEFAKEKAAIALEIEGLAAEEKLYLATIAQACAKGIQADMATPSIAADMFAIQAAIEKHNKEAEISRQGVRGTMERREEELDARRLEVHHKREAALEKWKEEFRSDTEALEEKKQRLERDGGIAMAVELGRRIGRTERAKAREG